MSRNYKPQNILRSQVMKNALKAFIVPAFLRKYNIVGVKSIVECRPAVSENTTIWKKRRELEVLFITNDQIVAFLLHNCSSREKVKEEPRK